MARPHNNRFIVPILDESAGVDKSIVAEGEGAIEHIALRALVTTDGTAGARQVTVELRDSAANILHTADKAATIAASQTDVVVPIHDTGDPVLPKEYKVPPGGDVRVYISANAQAGDLVELYGTVTRLA